MPDKTNHFERLFQPIFKGQFCPVFNPKIVRFSKDKIRPFQRTKFDHLQRTKLSGFQRTTSSGFQGQIRPISVQFGHKFDLFYSQNLFLFQIVLTFTNPEFSCFCYILALGIQHFLRLFGIKFATTKQFTSNSQIWVLFDYRSSPQRIRSNVVCYSYKTDTQNTSNFCLIRSSSVEGLTDTQNTSKSTLFSTSFTLVFTKLS